jgi:hypothetical protein
MPDVTCQAKLPTRLEPIRSRFQTALRFPFLGNFLLLKTVEPRALRKLLGSEVARGADLVEVCSFENDHRAWCSETETNFVKASRRVAQLQLWSKRIVVGAVCVVMLLAFREWQERTLFEVKANARLANGLRIVGTRQTQVDLEGWKCLTPIEMASKQKLSKFASRNMFKVKRTREEPTEFVHEIATSSEIVPEISCRVDIERRCRINGKPPSPHALANKQFELIVDLADLELGQSIDVGFDVIFWNNLQSRDEEYTGFRVIHDTDRVVYTIKFPSWNSARQDSLRYESTEPVAVKEPIPDGNVILEAAGNAVRSLRWTVDRPSTDRGYFAYWRWSTPCPS